MKEFWNSLGKWQKAGLILLVIIVLIGSGWLMFQKDEDKSYLEYDLFDEYLEIVADKNVYKVGEIVGIKVTNKFNEKLRIGLGSGCEGSIQGVSSYVNGEWVENPNSCGMCDSSVGDLEIEVGDSKYLEWNQIIFDRNVCSRNKKAEPGWYRIRIRVMTKPNEPRKDTYSLPFEIL